MYNEEARRGLETEVMDGVNAERLAVDQVDHQERCYNFSFSFRKDYGGDFLHHGLTHVTYSAVLHCIKEEVGIEPFNILFPGNGNEFAESVVSQFEVMFQETILEGSPRVFSLDEFTKKYRRNEQEDMFKHNQRQAQAWAVANASDTPKTSFDVLWEYGFPLHGNLPSEVWGGLDMPEEGDESRWGEVFEYARPVSDEDLALIYFVMMRTTLEICETAGYGEHWKNDLNLKQFRQGASDRILSNVKYNEIYFDYMPDSKPILAAIRVGDGYDVHVPGS